MRRQSVRAVGLQGGEGHLEGIVGEQRRDVGQDSCGLAGQGIVSNARGVHR